MSDPTYDVIITGCGPSGGTPSVRCLTRPKDSTFPPCNCCMASADPQDELGHGGLRNYRSNTSGVVVKTRPDGRKSTIVIDCGKTWHERIALVFPENGLRKIDAVLLTHEHADAILGVGDLRHFTLYGEIQESVPIWLDRATYDIFATRFPYLMGIGDTRSAGQQSSLTFHVFEYGETLEIAGMKIRPLPVFHGSASKTIISDDPDMPPTVVTEKMVAAAFEFDDDQLLWMSDVDEITDANWEMMKYPRHQQVGRKRESEVVTLSERQIESKVKVADEGEYDSGLDDDADDIQVTTQIIKSPARDADNVPSTSRLSVSSTADHYKLVIMDGTNLEGTRTHFGIPEWMSTGLRLQADKMILVQIEHRMSYGELFALGLEIQGRRSEGKHEEFIQKAKELCSKEPGLWEKCTADGFWVRPGYDGQRLRIEPGCVPVETLPQAYFS